MVTVTCYMLFQTFEYYSFMKNKYFVSKYSFVRLTVIVFATEVFSL